MNETALFSWIRATVPDESLQANAQADYRVDEEQHLAALRRIAAGDLQVLSPLKWHPREVLELTRNGTIASTDASARQRHQRRLFACLALLYAATELANDGHTIRDRKSVV